MNRLILTAALIFCISAQAMADVVRVDGWQYANETSIGFNIKTASRNVATSAGAFRTTINGESFLTYCVDLLQSFSWGTTYNNYRLAEEGERKVAWFTEEKSEDLGRLATGYADDVTDYITSAAFQLATWAIVTESGSEYSVKGHGMVVTSRFAGTSAQANLAINTAEAWLHNLPGYSEYMISVEYSPTQQDLMMLELASRDANHNDVPEPTSLMLVAMSLGLVIANRRRS